MALSMRIGRADESAGVSSRAAVASGDDLFEDESARRIRRSQGLPTGRALVGGLLVALAALGIVAAHRAATIDERAAYLVIARPVAAGARVVPADLALAKMDLHETTRRRALTDPAAVLGRVALIPLDEGDLVLRSSTASSPDPDSESRRIGLVLDSADALSGDLEAGDRVDVIAVPRADEAAEIIVRGAVVTQVGTSSDASVGADEEVRVNLDVADEEDARLLIEAHARGGVTLITASTLDLDGGR